MKNKIILLASILSILCFLIAFGLVFNKNNEKIIIVSNFDECSKAGFAILESYPRQCRTKNGKIFREDITLTPTQTPNDKDIFCPADAMLCPNGTYVGRDNSNNCQFLPCPTE